MTCLIDVGLRVSNSQRCVAKHLFRYLLKVGLEILSVMHIIMCVRISNTRIEKKGVCSGEKMYFLCGLEIKWHCSSHCMNLMTFP